MMTPKRKQKEKSGCAHPCKNKLKEKFKNYSGSTIAILSRTIIEERGEKKEIAKQTLWEKLKNAKDHSDIVQEMIIAGDGDPIIRGMISKDLNGRSVGEIEKLRGVKDENVRAEIAKSIADTGNAELFDIFKRIAQSCSHPVGAWQAAKLADQGNARDVDAFIKEETKKAPELRDKIESNAMKEFESRGVLDVFEQLQHTHMQRFSQPAAREIAHQPEKTNIIPQHVPEISATEFQNDIIRNGVDLSKFIQTQETFYKNHGFSSACHDHICMPHYTTDEKEAKEEFKQQEDDADKRSFGVRIADKDEEKKDRTMEKKISNETEKDNVQIRIAKKPDVIERKNSKRKIGHLKLQRASKGKSELEREPIGKPKTKNPHTGKKLPAPIVQRTSGRLETEATERRNVLCSIEAKTSIGNKKRNQDTRIKTKNRKQKPAPQSMEATKNEKKTEIGMSPKTKAKKIKRSTKTALKLKLSTKREGTKPKPKSQRKSSSKKVKAKPQINTDKIKGKTRKTSKKQTQLKAKPKTKKKPAAAKVKPKEETKRKKPYKPTTKKKARAETKKKQRQKARKETKAPVQKSRTARKAKKKAKTTGKKKRKSRIVAMLLMKKKKKRMESKLQPFAKPYKPQSSLYAQ